MLICGKCKPTFLRRKNFYNQLKSPFSAIFERVFEGRFRVFLLFSFFKKKFYGRLEKGFWGFCDIMGSKS